MGSKRRDIPRLSRALTLLVRHLATDLSDRKSPYVPFWKGISLSIHAHPSPSGFS